jgi:hypothetical protein
MGLSTSPTTSQLSTPASAAPIKPAKFVPCPRSNYSGEHLNDWITFRDSRYKNFDICPACFSASIALTRHAASFTRSARKALGGGYKCDFSGYWVRIAWAWIIANGERGDAHLLAEVTAVAGQEEPCPNDLAIAPTGTAKTEATRLWYTIAHPDNSGVLLDHFTICSFCVTSIYTIFPSVHTALPFARVSDTPGTGTCDILASSGRTTSYIEALMNAESTAQETESDADMDVLKNFVFRFAGLAECAREEIAVGNVYSIPQLPVFRVCEECHEQYIRPNASAGSQIALSFGAPVYAAEGFVCQLYSERMQKLWLTAVANNNMNYLRYKVIERATQEAEITTEITALKEKFAMLKKQAEDQEQLALMEQMMSQNSLHSTVRSGVGNNQPVRPLHCALLSLRRRIGLKTLC